jgi:hypothetical protein
MNYGADWLRKIDTLLKDETVVEVAAQALRGPLATKSPSQSPGDSGQGRNPVLMLKHTVRP